MSRRVLAIVNPTAGGGRCGKLAPACLNKLRAAGIDLEIAMTAAPGDATRLSREAYRKGEREFIAVGGDGTACEIVNGFYPVAATGERPKLGFLPLGTGNSFLRDFSSQGVEHALEAIKTDQPRACDVLRLVHAGGEHYFINLVSMGFTADVTAAANRRFKRLGELGYVLAVLLCLARLNRRAFPMRSDGQGEFDRRPCLFLSFNNSKFTGGKMMIAPKACASDGFIEYVRWGPIGRIGLLRNLSTLFDGSHLKHPLASRRAARIIEFAVDSPVDVMIDGEVLTLECRKIDVLPGALDVLV